MGTLQGRPVAVKRVLKARVPFADREVSHLKNVDHHQNVIRYYFCGSDNPNYFDIALELCSASLFDIMERRDGDDPKHANFREIHADFDTKRALREITSGLAHLHFHGIVHRDIKPQNILICISNADGGEPCGYRMVISDFGFSRKLESGETSFEPTVGGVEGTPGWMAPEILHGKVGTTTVEGVQMLQLTKAVDIFALGCLYYYCLMSGGHPFGDRSKREENTLWCWKSLQGLKDLKQDRSEADYVISLMLAAVAPAERCVC